MRLPRRYSDEGQISPITDHVNRNVSVALLIVGLIGMLYAVIDCGDVTPAGAALSSLIVGALLSGVVIGGLIATLRTMKRLRPVTCTVCKHQIDPTDLMLFGDKGKVRHVYCCAIKRPK